MPQQLPYRFLWYVLYIQHKIHHFNDLMFYWHYDAVYTMSSTLCYGLAVHRRSTF